MKNSVMLHTDDCWVRPSDITDTTKGLTLSGLMIDAKPLPVEPRQIDSREIRLWQKTERIYNDGLPSCQLSDALTATYGHEPLTGFKAWKIASELDDLWDCFPDPDDLFDDDGLMKNWDIVYKTPDGKYCVREL